jgi:Ca2+-binding EF-hand superfamily protein
MRRLLCALGLAVLAAVGTFGDGKGAAEARAAEDDVQDFVLLGGSRPVRVRLHVRIDDKPFPAVWDAFMRELFSYLDVNGDGQLDKDELERVPSAELLLGRGWSGFLFRLEEQLRPRVPLGKNKDGKVTLAELSDYYRRHGLPPFQLQLGATPRTMATPQAMSMPGRPGGMVGPMRKGLPKATDEEAEPASGSVAARTTFALLDADGDGKLTREELAAASAALLRADRNDDDVVTLQEVEAHARLEPARPADARVILLPGAGTPAGAPAGGRLDKKALADLLRRPPDLELTVRLSTKGQRARLELHPGGKGPPLPGAAREKDGRVLLRLGTASVQLRPGADMVRPDHLERFVTLDFFYRERNPERKGYFTAAEKDRMPLGGHFKMIDRNNDGKVTKEEYDDYLWQLSALQVKATASCVSLVLIEAGRGLFDLLDADRNGTLTAHEMAQAPGLLKRFDKAGRGYLTEADLPRSWHLLVRRGPAGGIGYSALPPNNPFVSRDTPPRPQAKAGPLWFRQMDDNGDGYVSRREFPGTDEQFRQIDTDGDGLISVEEATKADALVRKQP